MDRYRIQPEAAVYFLTFSVVEWLPVFIRSSPCSWTRTHSPHSPAPAKISQQCQEISPRCMTLRCTASAGYPAAGRAAARSAG